MVSLFSFYFIDGCIFLRYLTHVLSRFTTLWIGFDCGVFTCMFADFVTKDCEPVFNQTHITQCRQRIALSIMKNCAIE